MSVIGVYHCGLTVRDIERSIRFYTELIGLELAWRQESNTPYIERLTGVPGTHLLVAYLRPPGSDGPYVELLQYLAPPGTPVDTTPNNPGTGHVCFFVPDLDEAHARLTAAGVEFVSPPNLITAGVHEGSKTVYLLDPDGIRVELFERRHRPTP
jgi:catechol 2,3-dioxygenase-like lactoylglutathione lyase family enzyme